MSTEHEAGAPGDPMSPGAGSSGDGGAVGPGDVRLLGDDDHGTDEWEATVHGPRMPAAPEVPAGPVPVTAPSSEDAVVRRLSALVGGPAGRRIAGSRGFWRAVTVLTLLAAAMICVGVVQKQHCRAEGWGSPDFFWHGCYSDTAILYSSAGLGGDAAVSLPEAVASAKLGTAPLTSAVMWVVAKFVDDPTARVAARQYFDLSAVVLGAVLVIGVAALASVSGRRPWDAAHLAVSPVLAFTALINYDLLAVGLLACALHAWARRRVIVAGVLFGLAVDSRFLLAVVVLAICVVAVRAGQGRAAAWFSGTALFTAAGLRLVLYPGATGGVLDTLGRWKEDGAGFGSLWLIPQLIGQNRPADVPWWPSATGLSSTVVTIGTIFGTVVLVVGVLVVALSSEYRPRVAHVALAAVCAVLVMSKSLSPQATLVLLPLIAVAGLKWRDHLIWAASEIVYFMAVWLYIAGESTPNRGLPAGLYLLFLLWRLGSVSWLGIQAVRAMMDPVHDVVRIPEDGTEGFDDPHGGVVDGCRDHLLVRFY